MKAVQQLLASLCEDIEKQVKPNLRGFTGVLVANYLPQVWVFETEAGSCTLFLDTEGNARIFPGADKDRDVTIRWSRDYLISVLKSRNHDSIPAGEYPEVFVQTDKGRAAFHYLKKEIGL